ncbi:hypothetical protein BD626DRAFT_512761 [Schizophyllum amplum]|uniref:Uncharacterized protein n=1 Tax=Schizophyllum amplum TaxID=97359 RepID=A0A550BZX1_9AGAR|nr:hypothetical protein BD626DRAFT_560637 [Auriculariopsis ampla]TRM58095.1 hypothetical protein BD626DRAFT_512761 [Auriculariopsis ampla]
MGVVQSQIPSEVVVAAVFAGAAGVGYSMLGGTKAEAPAQQTTDASSSATAPKKAKKKKSSAALASFTPATAKEPLATPKVVDFPDVIPGQFEPEPQVAAAPQTSGKKKQKKNKKGKSAGSGADTADSRPNTPAPAPAPPPVVAAAVPASAPKSKKGKKQQSKPDMSQSFAAIDTDGEWTRVEARRGKAATGASPSEGANPSDTGAASSITGTDSPVAERTEEESEEEAPKTLAEKLVPKAPKTGVADMLETPENPTLARVMRVTPRPDEKPASGFSWADYEDVQVEGGGNDADGEDDGWGVVKSRSRSKVDRPSTPGSIAQKDSDTLSKRQRQNAKKREAEKASKADAEAERLATLAKHKRELEKTRMMEQYAKGKGKQSGGMTATVDEHGKLVWE